MNNPSPFVPQGSNLEQKNSSRARVRLAVFCVLSIQVIGLMALLMIGCRKPQEPELPPPTENMESLPSLDATNIDTSPTNPYTTPEPQPVQPEPQQPEAYVPPQPVPVVPTTQEYTVVKGDTFATIAKKFPGLTTRQLQEANPTVVPTKMQIGQKLQIPAASQTAPTAAAPTMNTSTSSGSVYTVKSGDTLTTIAKRNGTTVKALRAANNLTTDKIRVGQKLTLPTTAPAVAPVPTDPYALPSSTPAQQ